MIKEPGIRLQIHFLICSIMYLDFNKQPPLIEEIPNKKTLLQILYYYFHHGEEII